MDIMRIKLYDILLALSNAVDLVSPEIANHQQQVAFLSYRIAEQIGLSKEKQREIMIAGLMHDIGAITADERLALIEDEPISVNNHAFRGAKLLKKYKPFTAISNMVRYHHVPWNFGKGAQHKEKEVPYESHIIHLADRVCAMIDKNKDVLPQIPDILLKMKSKEDNIFMPELLDALMDMGSKEFIWLELLCADPLSLISDDSLFDMGTLEVDDVVKISKIFSHIIDFRSRFTATHSAGVAKTAEKLGEIVGLSQNKNQQNIEFC
ncbi:MAG: HD domain-containing protein [Clostridia bacterium]|nr:HD domain-containing protein [Clostridia bacterium]